MASHADLKNTLQLPKTDFPMRASLPQREPIRAAHWEKLGLYDAIQQKRAANPDSPAFVLHDGPPFTNGDVHIGTALNKSLKDITLRYKTMRGYRTPYVPGWDCHGLPIEQKVTREFQAAGKTVGVNLTTAELRARCDAFSEEWIARQTAQFKRLGVLADWPNEYKTKAPAYEAEIIKTFAAFVENGLVYRSKKPVYWSIPFETALAEAEIEYKDHISPSIWVKFAVDATERNRYRSYERVGLTTGRKDSERELLGDNPFFSKDSVFVVIWTTTPWTLPANLAIAVHPDIEYVEVVHDKKTYVVASALADAFIDTCKLTGATKGNRYKGISLAGLQTRHPFIDRPSPIVLADYVTTESGTGCVHTAPGHGSEDYLTGLKYGLEIYCPVGDDGRYLNDGKVPADLVGLTCLETTEDLDAKRTSPANIAVLKKLDAANALLAKARYTHSYPHCWRSKTPIIFRAVDQWFVSLDKAGHRTKALAAIDQVQWVPAWGAARIRGAVESRPDWCISRQRSWGVPIIAFYGPSPDKTAYLDAGVARAVADKIERNGGTNYWYETPAAEILAGIALPPHWPAPGQLTCGRDTLDVWIDSGSSHAAVLKHAQGNTRWPADLYLEGSDQHRGWFQSSLWCGVIAQGGAPYKAVLTHGFIVGKDGKKISKSGQYEKPPTSDNYIAQYGADVIRLWVASQDFTQDITVSDLDKDLKDKGSILNIVAEAYRLFRNTLRYQLSTLHDFDPAKDALPVEQLDTLDRWALHQTARLLADCTAAYDAYEYHRVITACSQFCATTLSAVYHDIIKDRLYTLAVDSPLRRSTQTAIHGIFDTLVKILAPVITFTADEAWTYGTARKELADTAAGTIHLQDWPSPPPLWTNAEIDTDVAALLAIRAKVTEAIEPHRQAGKIGKSLDAAVTLHAAPGTPARALLEKHRDSLAELFIVSHVTLAPASPADAADAPLTVTVAHCQDHGHVRCPRCWRWVPALIQSTAHDTEPVCPRCAEALDAQP
ncbi:isoleucine--tRNA ligase [Geminisphaera colitermitum]|uniref:isoleucine--tRNA ligase n=1 Tax=Geminisphaera colitermitum TaxID=1148786 RepID=UPI000158C685|nr:isoleucine--tRNA ligase [Geminisphaera colitermitum]